MRLHDRSVGVLPPVPGGRGPADVLRPAAGPDAGALVSAGAAGVRVHAQGVAARHARRVEPALPAAETSSRYRRPPARRQLPADAPRAAGMGEDAGVHTPASRDGDPAPVPPQLPSD